MERPLRLRLLLRLIRVASALTPRRYRGALRANWEAELLHLWSRRVGERDGSSGTSGSEGLPPMAASAPPRSAGRAGHPIGLSAPELLRWSVGPFLHGWHIIRAEYTVDSIWQDARYGCRALRRSRGLITIATLSLAIGIGATTTIFSMVDVFLFKALPYPDPDRLLVVWTTNEDRGVHRWRFSVPDLVDLEEQCRTMELAGMQDETFNLSGEFDAERLAGTYVTPGFLRVLGVKPALGRGFVEEDGIPGHENVAIISHELWERRFGSDPGLLGQDIVLDGEPHVLVGIMPSGFWVGSPGVDLWVPGVITGEEPRDFRTVGVIGRLKEGHTQEQAMEEVARSMALVNAAHPETNAGNGATLETLHDAVFDSGFKAGSAISMAAVALVLLIACANVASLLLTHATGREREVALRGALGAGGSRIVRQFLTEAFLIAALGGILGIFLATFGIRELVSLMPSEIPRVHEMTLGPRVLLFTAAVTVATAALFGLAPALQSGRAELTESLRGGGRGRNRPNGGRIREGLVVAEVAMALVLLVSSALLVQGFQRLRLGEMGFDRSDVVAMRTQLPGTQYGDTARVNAFYQELAERLRNLPGVEAVGGTSILPGQGRNVIYYLTEDGDLEDPSQRHFAAFRYLLPGYLEALDIPLLRGRDFEEGDGMGAPRVALVSESLARRHWPDTDPVGQFVRGSSGPREVIGVVGDTRNPGQSDEPREMIYFSALQTKRPFMEWAIESTLPVPVLMESVKGQIRAVDPTIPAYDVMNLDALIDEGLGGSLIMAKIMGAAGLMALILALGGVYGVMAYAVSQRTREIGIRMSLGARRGHLMVMVLRQGTALALIGIAAGVGVALAVTRGLSHFLFGVSPVDPVTFLTVSVILLGAGFAATVLPARRATKVDPLEALNTE